MYIWCEILFNGPTEYRYTVNTQIAYIVRANDTRTGLFQVFVFCASFVHIVCKRVSL